MKKSIPASALAYPMMVEMIGTYDEDGTPNLMNAAWGGQLTTDLFVLSLSKDHKTVENILARKAFTIGFPRARDAVDCDYVGIVSGNEVKDKVARTSFHPRKSEV
ncbi:MAG: flavin oxidoreductase, partial [Bacilli bacterium]|nr:flavin oxidoreductase [Bacilli bacterium]